MDNYISREEITNRLHVYAITVDTTNTLSSVLRNIVRDTPAADVRPVVRGEWRKSGFSLRGVPIFSCSFCKESLETSSEFIMKTTYCPFCGADMRGDG